MLASDGGGGSNRVDEFVSRVDEVSKMTAEWMSCLRAVSYWFTYLLGLCMSRGAQFGQKATFWS